MSRLADAARKYMGVRFRHRGRSPQALDCVGLAWLAYKDCGEELPDYRLYGAEPARHGPRLTEAMKVALGEPIAVEPVDHSILRDGDVVVIRYEHEPHHVAVIGTHPLGYPSLIHAHGVYKRVLEQGLPPGLKMEKGGAITHVFRRPV